MPLPDGYTLRAPKPLDHQDYLATLAVLTTVGDVTAAQFEQLLSHWAEHPSIYFPQVIVDANDTVVATGMLVVEQKLIHGCGKVGHVEDIAVAKSQQGKKLGNTLICHLSELARSHGCYKVLLDCLPANVGFYEKCGYKDLGVYMTVRYD